MTVTNPNIGLVTEIDEAVTYFSVPPEAPRGAAPTEKTPEEIASDVVAKPGDPMIGFGLLGPGLSPSALPQAKRVREDLMDLGTLGSAKARALASKSGKSLADAEIWQEIYNHYPLTSVGVVADSTFEYRGRAFEISTAVVETLLGIASGGATGALVPVVKGFVSSLGEKIRVQTEETKSALQLVVMSAVVLPDGYDGLVARTDVYLLGQNDSKKLVQTNCASHEEIDISIRAYRVIGTFNHRALENPEQRKLWDQAFAGIHTTDLKNKLDWLTVE